MHGKDYKEKKEKKEKAREQHRQMMSKFIKDDPSGSASDASAAARKSESSEWRKYEEMLGKSDEHAKQSKEKLTQMEASFEGQMSKLWGMPVKTAKSSSPWGEEPTVTSMLDEPIDESAPPKVGWVGFDDDFAKPAASDAEVKPASKVLSTVKAKSPPPRPKPPSPVKESTGDLLGLVDDPSSEAPADDVAVAEVVEKNFNPLEDDVTSPEAGAPGVSSIVDDFLGITSSSQVEAPAASQDPLEKIRMLTSPKVADADVSDTQVASASADLDDLFGFSASNAPTATATAASTDLFDLMSDAPTESQASVADSLNALNETPKADTEPSNEREVCAEMKSDSDAVCSQAEASEKQRESQSVQEAKQAGDDVTNVSNDVTSKSDDAKQLRAESDTNQAQQQQQQETVGEKSDDVTTAIPHSTSGFDDFDPRAEVSSEKLKQVAPVKEDMPVSVVCMPSRISWP